MGITLVIVIAKIIRITVMANGRVKLRNSSISDVKCNQLREERHREPAPRALYKYPLLERTVRWGHWMQVECRSDEYYVHETYRSI